MIIQGSTPQRSNNTQLLLRPNAERRNSKRHQRGRRCSCQGLKFGPPIEERALHKGPSMRMLFTVSLLLVISASVLIARSDSAYDPLLVDKYQPAQQDLTVKDEKRSREIPIRVYLPKEKLRRRSSCLVTGWVDRAKARPISAIIGRRVVMWRCFCSTRAATIQSGRTNRRPSAWRRCERRRIWKTSCFASTMFARSLINSINGTSLPAIR